MKYISLLFIVLLAACGQPSLLSDNIKAQLPDSTDQFIPIADTDTTYTNYYNVQPVTTPHGWNITYMVKNDSTRFTDAYIQWQKGNVKRVYKYPHVLEYRGQFMPQFLDETDTHIFMDHACATECRAILALPKNNKDKAIDFESVLGFNTKLGQVVTRTFFINDEIVRDGKLIIEATDLTKGITKSVTFKNTDYSVGNAMMDTVIFKGDRILVKWEFYSEDEEFTETQVIQF
ncbi:hypothetical protein AM493_12620 [Flavobacterium akiainvivens]|uniref:Uncharacterized protein n=1 Tax=Flavobacterium akiainvivens TaxID=1202724 RepID=A0A0N0RQT7_9FLAO|nr:hypothetical protein [Flavobacterium akiainvivens]KOS06772.1 hypothetical protein AM493_12620 [Flavobacterium akiainvivens]SFQ77089.1 hypothetical protein SAMN05444144_12516 [Flavobacterium akiainvivens]